MAKQGWGEVMRCLERHQNVTVAGLVPRISRARMTLICDTCDAHYDVSVTMHGRFSGSPTSSPAGSTKEEEDE